MVRYAQKPDRDDKERKITFISKEATRCPVCDASFRREELFSGRVNAGELTDELHRTYIPMQAYGEVHPLVYDVTVCPSCWYAAYKTDFLGIPPKVVHPLSEGIAARVEAVQRLFSPLDFSSPRGLMEGAASYYLAMLCYEHFSKEYSPAIKQGISALRAAWLCTELEEKHGGQNYGYAAKVFYSKARFLYRVAVESEQKGKESLTTVKWLGPDTDKNYGYEGVLYLVAVLELKYGPTADEAKRAELLTDAKRTVAKMFGLGKKTRTKPGPLVDKVRDLYDMLKAELKQEDDEDDD
ncbi:MAG TPA: DUF2225 domain-containing protein [Rectinemataceae bacterium]|nr:DUF2225 domain-containing protein [Rectinemataceae bacterium]